MTARDLLPLARKMLAAGWKPGVVAGILNGAMAESSLVYPSSEELFTTKDMEKLLELITMEERKEKAWLN